MFRIKWPQQHDDMLRELIADVSTQWSYSELASLLNKKFNSGYSRNAVIGRANRLGIGIRSGPRGHNLKIKIIRKRSPSADDKIRIAARSNLPASYVRAAQPRMVCDAPPLADDRSGGGARNVALVELTGCRWPAGDGIAVPFTFCNASFAFKGCAYCAEHRRMALRHAA